MQWTLCIILCFGLALTAPQGERSEAGREPEEMLIRLVLHVKKSADGTQLVVDFDKSEQSSQVVRPQSKPVLSLGTVWRTVPDNLTDRSYDEGNPHEIKPIFTTPEPAHKRYTHPGSGVAQVKPEVRITENYSPQPKITDWSDAVNSGVRITEESSGSKKRIAENVSQQQNITNVSHVTRIMDTNPALREGGIIQVSQENSRNLTHSNGEKPFMNPHQNPRLEFKITLGQPVSSIQKIYFPTSSQRTPPVTWKTEKWPTEPTEKYEIYEKGHSKHGSTEETTTNRIKPNRPETKDEFSWVKATSSSNDGAWSLSQTFSTTTQKPNRPTINFWRPLVTSTTEEPENQTPSSTERPKDTHQITSTKTTEVPHRVSPWRPAETNSQFETEKPETTNRIPETTEGNSGSSTSPDAEVDPSGGLVDKAVADQGFGVLASRCSTYAPGLVSDGAGGCTMPVIKPKNKNYQGTYTYRSAAGNELHSDVKNGNNDESDDRDDDTPVALLL